MKYFLLTSMMVVLTLYTEAQTIIKMNTRNNNPNEVSIAIHPTYPAYMVAGSNIRNLYFSSDTGKTWQEKDMKSSMGVYGDPVVYFLPDGTCLFLHLAMNQSKENKGYDGLDRIVIQRSVDNGHTFSDGTYCGLNPPKIQDKPWISFDRKSNVYVSWTEFDAYGSNDPAMKSRIRFASSNDRGVTFNEAITVSDTTGDCIDSDNTLEGATTAVDENGVIYMAWAAFGNIYFDKSTDGGKTWGKDQIISSQNRGWDIPIENIYRGNGLPFLVYDGAKTLYLLYASEYEGTSISNKVYIVRSSDKGKSWSAPVCINEGGNTIPDGFMPNICVDPSDHNVYIAWYDRRNSASRVFADIYMAQFNATKNDTFKVMRVTPKSFELPGKEVFFGDYIGIAASNSIVAPAWAIQKDNELELNTVQIYTHQPPPVTSLSKDYIFQAKMDFSNKRSIIHLEKGNNTLQSAKWYYWSESKEKWKRIKRLKVLEQGNSEEVIIPVKETPKSEFKLKATLSNGKTYTVSWKTVSESN